jgi:hypothetical protein
VTYGRVSFADSCRELATVQSGGCGIAIRGSAVYTTMQNSSRRMVAGDSVRVDGYLCQTSGRSEFAVYDEVVPVIRFLAAGRPLPPAGVDCAAISLSAEACEGEAFESCYVRVGPVTFAAAGGLFAGETSYYATCDGHTIRYFVSACDPLVGDSIPTGAVMITGIASQYVNAACCCSGYELEFAVATTPCKTPLALTVQQDSLTTNRLLHWEPGLDQTCDCFEIYYTVDPASSFPSGYTRLTHVAGTNHYVDTDAPATRRFYVVTAGGPDCP